GDSIRDQARDLFKRDIADRYNVWMVQKVSGASWEKTDVRTIRVSIHFKYGSGRLFDDIHEGLIQINFVDSGWKGGGKIYKIGGIGLYGYNGRWGGELQDKVREVLHGHVGVQKFDEWQFAKNVFSQAKSIAGGDSNWSLSKVEAIDGRLRVYIYTDN